MDWRTEKDRDLPVNSYKATPYFILATFYIIMLFIVIIAFIVGVG